MQQANIHNTEQLACVSCIKTMTHTHTNKKLQWQIQPRCGVSFGVYDHYLSVSVLNIFFISGVISVLIQTQELSTYFASYEINWEQNKQGNCLIFTLSGGSINLISKPSLLGITARCLFGSVMLLPCCLNYNPADQTHSAVFSIYSRRLYVTAVV